MNVIYQKLTLTGLLAVSIGSIKGMESNNNNNNSIVVAENFINRLHGNLEITPKVVQEYMPRASHRLQKKIQRFNQEYDSIFTRLLTFNMPQNGRTFWADLNAMDEANFELIAKVCALTGLTNHNATYKDKYLVQLNEEFIVKISTAGNRGTLTLIGHDRKGLGDLVTHQTDSMADLWLRSNAYLEVNPSSIVIPKAWMSVVDPKTMQPTSGLEADDSRTLMIYEYIKDLVLIVAGTPSVTKLSDPQLEDLYFLGRDTGAWPITSGNLGIKEGILYLVGGMQQQNETKPTPQDMDKKTGYGFTGNKDPKHPDSRYPHAFACFIENVAKLLAGAPNQAKAWLKVVCSDPAGQQAVKSYGHILNPIKEYANEEQLKVINGQ